MSIFYLNKLGSRDNLVFAMKLCLLANKPKELIKEAIKALCSCSEDVKFIYGDYLFGFFAKFKGFAFIAFRGSQIFGDWISNFDIRLIRGGIFIKKFHR